MKKVLLVAAIVALMAVPMGAYGSVWYVKVTGNNTNDGRSWNTAFATIQKAIDTAADGDEIWVAQGRYRLSSRIVVNKAVKLYGGFSGNETNRTHRDWENRKTIVDGDGRDRCFWISADATLDGLHITGGTTDASGGGISVEACNPLITDCNIYNNSAISGGGIYNIKSNSTITNCAIHDNTASIGGGISNVECPSLTITHCNIYTNTAHSTGGGVDNYASNLTMANSNVFQNKARDMGGGMSNFYYSHYTLINCNIYDNTAGVEGGGIFNYTVNSIITNCNIYGNNATTKGGGISQHSGLGNSTITNCNIYGNSVHEGGGGIESDRAFYSITNTVIWANDPNGIDIYTGPSPLITYSNVQEEYSGKGNISEDPHFVDPANGDFHLSSDSPCIDVGCNTAPEISDKDFEGDPRIVDGNDDGKAVADMGTDEYCVHKVLTIDPVPQYGTIKVEDKIACGVENGNCVGSFCEGSTITLHAVLSGGYPFRGWGGDCSQCESTDCTLVMDRDKQCTAFFGSEFPITIVWPANNSTINYDDFEGSEGLLLFVWRPLATASGYRMYLGLDDGSGPQGGEFTLQEGNGEPGTLIVLLDYDLAGIYLFLDKATWNALVPYTVIWQVKALDETGEVIGKTPKASFGFNPAP